MQKVKLDPSKLLGFKIVADQTAELDKDSRIAAKVGEKNGPKVGVKGGGRDIGVCIGAKVGEKGGKPGIGASIGAKIGRKGGGGTIAACIGAKVGVKGGGNNL